MRGLGHWLKKQIATGLVVLLAAPLVYAEPTLPLQASPISERQGVSNTQEQSTGPRDDSERGGGDPAKVAETLPEAPTPTLPQAVPQNQQVHPPESNPQQPQTGDITPVGTAAAPYGKPTGVAASRPAGAAIAGAKQRRARSFLIRISMVVGAAVAVGTVVALSRASSSRPN